MREVDVEEQKRAAAEQQRVTDHTERETFLNSFESQLGQIQTDVEKLKENGTGGNANIDDTQVSKETTWSSEQITNWSMEQDGVFWTEKVGNFISADDTYEYKLKEIEVFGDTWQDENNLEDIQHAGELYVDDEGQPILDAEGKEQYKFEIEVCNANFYKEGFVKWDSRVLIDEEEIEFLASSSIKNFVDLEPNTQYTFGCRSKKLTDGYTNIRFYYTDGTNSTHGFESPLNEFGKFTTATSNLNKTIESFAIFGNANKSRITDLVISEGTKTENIPHKSYKQTILLPCQLMRVGDVADRLFWNDDKGKYVVEKNVEMAILNGLETWRIDRPTETHQTMYIDKNSHDEFANFKTQALPNMFSSYTKKVVTTLDTWTAIEKCMAYGNNDRYFLMFRVDKSEYDTISSWTTELIKNNITVYFECETPQLIETNITEQLTIPTYNNKTHVYVINSNNAKATIKAKFPLKTASAVATLNVESTKNSKDIDKLQDSNVDLIGANFEIDFRLSEVEWTLEDAGLATPVTALKNIKLGGNTMALTRFEQAKILILAGEYDKERMTYQLTRYLERGYIKQNEYDELIALMEAKELVTGE